MSWPGTSARSELASGLAACCGHALHAWTPRLPLPPPLSVPAGCVTAGCWPCVLSSAGAVTLCREQELSSEELLKQFRLDNAKQAAKLRQEFELQVRQPWGRLPQALACGKGWGQWE